MPGLGVSIKIVFEETDAKPGDTCIQCAKELFGTKYVMMLQIGEAEAIRITAFDASFCEECSKTT